MHLTPPHIMLASCQFDPSGQFDPHGESEL